MAVAPQLLAVLVDPEDKQSLQYIESESCLYNERLHRRYSVNGDIPVLLVSDAETVTDDEHERLIALVESK